MKDYIYYIGENKGKTKNKIRGIMTRVKPENMDQTTRNCIDAIDGTKDDWTIIVRSELKRSNMTQSTFKDYPQSLKTAV